MISLLAKIASFIVPPLLNWLWDKSEKLISQWEERQKAKSEKPKS